MGGIQLELTIEEVNLILESLAERPYVKVHGLIAGIQEQAVGQLQAATATETRLRLASNAVTAGDG